MQQYKELCKKILAEGVLKEDRTGTGTISIFGHQSRYDISKNFPLLTTKKMWLPKGHNFKAIIYELLWFLKGSTNTAYLEDNGVTIWREWQDENGDLGPIYGHQWRSWEAPNGSQIDQIKDVIERIKTNPNDRRLIVSAWNVGDIPRMALPPCHLLFQFYVTNGKLSCQLYQRSADVFLGVPFNIASYSALVYMIAQVVGLQPGEFIHTLGDAHIYLNHVEQVKLLLSRQCLPLPELRLNKEVENIDDFKFSDFKIIGYSSWPSIKGDVSI